MFRLADVYIGGAHQDRRSMKKQSFDDDGSGLALLSGLLRYIFSGILSCRIDDGPIPAFRFGREQACRTDNEIVVPKTRL